MTTQDLIARHRQIVDHGREVRGRGHRRPFKGRPEWDPAAEASRQEVNASVRDSGDLPFRPDPWPQGPDGRDPADGAAGVSLT
ncbi:hypothetical protein ACWDAZ_33660, partial [Streptomyces sp. NPDC001215]